MEGGSSAEQSFENLIHFSLILVSSKFYAISSELLIDSPNGKPSKVRSSISAYFKIKIDLEIEELGLYKERNAEILS